MNLPGRRRLRIRLLALALVAVVPALAVIIYTQAVERQHARERSFDEIRRLTRLASAQESSVFVGAHRFLLTLSQFPVLRRPDPAGCNALLPAVLHDHPGYINIWVSRPDGTTLCSAVPVDPRASARNKSWFQRVMQTKTTAIGDYQIGMTNGQPDVVLGHPLLGPSGEVERIAAVAIGLDYLNGIAARAQLPRGATMVLFDGRGTILAHRPDGAARIGRSITELRMPHPSAGIRPEMAGVVGDDGVSRLYTTTPLEADLDTGLHVALGVERDAALAETNHLLRQQWELLVLMALAIIAAAVIGGEWFVLRPINVLTDATRRLARGDLAARARLAGGVPGVTELADAVNAMAMALEARQREREESEAELRASEEKLRHAQKMEAIGQLAAGIAHNFNNLLTVIAGCTELMLARHPAPGEDRSDLEEIRKSAQRGAALTRQVLVFSREHEAQQAQVDLNSAVTDLQETLRRVIREDIALSLELAPQRVPILADPQDVEQVILNLVLNARDALPSGGTIHLDLSRLMIAETNGSGNTGREPGEYVRLRVQDNGVGMAPETRRRLFEPFFTTKEVGKGTGLGLAFVYGVVRRSGGFVTVDSTLGSGTTFAAHFPLASGPVTNGSESPRRAISRTSRGETILLIEDEDAVRAVSARALILAGYRVLEASAAGQACRLFQEHAAEIALLVTDVVMPEAHGTALAEQFVAERPGLRVLLVSGHLQGIGIPVADRVRFLGKPFTPSDLVAAVADAIN